MKKIILLLFVIVSLTACKNKDQKDDRKTISPAVASQENQIKKKNDSIEVTPISHASFMMKLNDKIIYFDPVGENELYKNLPKPDLVVLTDIHNDHLSTETLNGIIEDSITIIAPKAVKDELPAKLQHLTDVMSNGDKKEYFDIQFEAIPMYNLREEAKKFHTKGRGNGYVLTYNNKNIYVSGDTEDIPEMRNLKNIDVAFVCMNLPYTMPVEAAADAVLDFKPKKVYPYHYRGKDGFSDIEKFKNIVETNNPSIQVMLLDWY